MTAWSIHIRFYSKQTRRLSQSRSHGFRAQKLDLWASLTNTVWAMNCKVSCNTNNSSAPRARCFSRCCCFRVFQWMVLRAFVHCFFLFLFFFLSVFVLDYPSSSSVYAKVWWTEAGCHEQLFPKRMPCGVLDKAYYQQMSVQSPGHGPSRWSTIDYNWISYFSL